MYSGSPSTKSAIGIDGYALARSRHDATMHATTTEMPRRRSVAPMKPPQYEKSSRYMSSSRLKPPSVTAYAIERCHVFCSSGPHCRRVGGERGGEGWVAGGGRAAAHVGAVGADRALGVLRRRAAVVAARVVRVQRAVVAADQQRVVEVGVPPRPVGPEVGVELAAHLPPVHHVRAVADAREEEVEEQHGQQHAEREHEHALREHNITSSVETGSASNVDASASIVPGTRGSSAFDCAKAPWPGMAA